VRGWGIGAGALLHALVRWLLPCWVEEVAVEASASGSSDVGLENLAAASDTESGALVLASVAGSSGVA
jgi:hypothetical protein